jgi:hypothetical protein
MEATTKFDILLDSGDIFDLSLNSDDTIDIDLIDKGAGGGGTKDYSKLTNKPQINGVELDGNRSFEDLGVGVISAAEVIDIVNDAFNQVFN